MLIKDSEFYYDLDVVWLDFKDVFEIYQQNRPGYLSPQSLGSISVYHLLYMIQ